MVGTDRGRFDSYTEEFARNQRRLFAGTPYQFRHFEKTADYANLPLDGLWLRGPHLHNGSVPTLADSLEPPEAHPTTFIRGLDTPDPKQGGFLAPTCCNPQASADGAKGFCFDTSLPGNNNHGHLWGTDLSVPRQGRSTRLSFDFLTDKDCLFCHRSECYGSPSPSSSLESIKSLVT